MAHKLEWHVNSQGLSNDVLDNLMESSHTCDLYFGTFPFDNLPFEVCKNDKFILIVNVGLHFVCIYGKRDMVLYIDSLGKAPRGQEMKSFLLACERDVFFNKKRIQSLVSTHCGLYACLFGLYFCKKENKKTVARMVFEKHNLMKNDQLCLKYLKRLLLV